MHDQTFYSLALSLVPGLGRQRLCRIIGELDSPSSLFGCSRRRLRLMGLSPEARADLLSRRPLKMAEKVAKTARSQGIRILSLFDDAYPLLLRQIYDPPVILYCLGNLEILQSPIVALVGSRRCSVYGRQISRKLARELSALGLTIASGMARGVDSQAHLGALEAGGKTIAVLGNGVDVIYPREHRTLYSRIRCQGCIVSEFPCGSFPAPQNFPIRNRIISGLSYGTIIGEASEYSGSLITARLTLEQNRELWAVPGNVTSKGSYGPNYLIKQGAHLVITEQDVLDELPLALLDSLAKSKKAEAAKPGELPDGPRLSNREQSLLALLPSETAIHFDSLLEESGLEMAQLNHSLLDLEMKGLILQLPGRRFSRKLN